MKTLIPAVLAIFALLRPELSTAAPIAYVANQSNNVVHMLRTTDWANLGSIPVGNAPTSIAIPTSGGFAVVANKGSNSVSRINLASSTVTATIPVPGNPTSVAVMPNGARAYAVQSTNCPALPSPTAPPGPTPTPGGPTPAPTPLPPCTVAVLDMTTNTVVGSVTVGHAPFAIAMSQSGGFAYVTNRADDTVSVIDTASNTVVETFPVGDNPEGVAVGQGVIYITNDVSNAVNAYREIDRQPLATIPVGASPLSVAVSPDGRTAVVGNDLGSSISLVDTSTAVVTGTKPVGTNPAGIAITPDSTVAVVANSTDGTVSIVPLVTSAVDPTPTQTITLLGSPSSVAITPSPFFVMLKTASPAVVAAGSTVVYKISYVNFGSGPSVATTITDDFPAELTFVSATNGGGLSGGDVVWNLGTLPIAASGFVEATFNVAGAPPLIDGAEITNLATIADSAGNTVSESLTIGTRVSGGLGLVQANYSRQAPKTPSRDSWRMKTQIPALAGGFNNDVPVTITWATPSQIVTTFTIPSGAWTGRAGRNRYRFNGANLLGAGSRIRGTLSLRGTGANVRWHLGITLARTPLPVVDDPANITISAAFGADIYQSTREFKVRKSSRPGMQRLSYRSVIASD